MVIAVNRRGDRAADGQHQERLTRNDFPRVLEQPVRQSARTRVGRRRLGDGDTRGYAGQEHDQQKFRGHRRVTTAAGS